MIAILIRLYINFLTLEIPIYPAIYILSLSQCLTLFISLSQVMTRHRTNPGDAEEKRYSCHRVNCVTMDPPHHCVAPKCNCSPACHPKGYQTLLHTMICGVAVSILLSTKMWQISAQSLIDFLMISVSRFICAHLNIVMLEKKFAYDYSHYFVKKEVLLKLFSCSIQMFSL